jgi:hypothetical protein
MIDRRALLAPDSQAPIVHLAVPMAAGPRPLIVLPHGEGVLK